jgi:hypothetical protein
VRRYTIARTETRPPLSGAVADTVWAAADTATLDQFPWHDPRDPPATVRVCYDDTALYWQVQVPDTRIAASETEPNGQVWTDSAVEWFFAPDDVGYFNLEINCVGTPLLAWTDDERVWIDAENVQRIEIATSVDGPTKTPDDGDEAWWIAVALPFAVLADLRDRAVAPEAGDRWRGNFHRLSSDDEAQVGLWNPIETPERDLHRPDFFGELQFG